MKFGGLLLNTGGLGSENFGSAAGILVAGTGNAPRAGAPAADGATDPASIANSSFLLKSVMKEVPIAYFGFLFSFISSLNLEY